MYRYDDIPGDDANPVTINSSTHLFSGIVHDLAGMANLTPRGFLDLFAALKRKENSFHKVCFAIPDVNVPTSKLLRSAQNVISISRAKEKM